MQTDNDNGTSQEVTDGLDSTQESMVHWLMDELDKDEPSEKLFVVDRQAPVDMSLSAFEAEIAARPMQRGRDGADSFDAYVGEEVVMSSDSASGDIYQDSPSADLSEDLNIEEVMALDFSRDEELGVFEGKIDVADGDDILGLEEDDDIGETYLTVKRVKKGVEAEVAQPAPVAPVQEAPPEEPAPVAAEAAIDTQSDSVEDYIAANPAPSDDEEFDDYLVAGADLEETDSDIGGLELVAQESIVDVTPDEPVDLPEEIQEVAAAAGENILSAVTPLIGPLMEELNGLLATRLSAMGRPADAVYADFSLASDEASTNMARSQDYAPVMEVFTEIPSSLAELSETQRKAVFLRLCWMDSGDICNNLFRENTDKGVIEMDVPPVLRAVDNTVFDEGILDEDLDADLAPSGWEPGKEDTDIDALFGEFDGADSVELADETTETLDKVAASPAVESAPAPQPPAAAPAAPLVAQDTSWCVPADLPFSRAVPEGGSVLENFLDAFVEEGTIEVEKLGETFEAWELSPADADIHKEIARALHTLKGISKGIGLLGFGTLIENFEVLFGGLPKPEAKEEKNYFRIMHAWREAAVQGVAAIKANRCDIGSVIPYVEAPADYIAAEPIVAVATPDQAVPVEETLDEPLAEAAPQAAEVDAENLDSLRSLAGQEQALRAHSSDIFTEIQAKLSAVRGLVADIENTALQGELDGLAVLIERASNNNAEAEALLEKQSEAVMSLGGQTPGAPDSEVVAGTEPASAAEQAQAAPAPREVEDGVFALVVDDSRTQRMVATSQLGTIGVETETAENGAVAIDWLNTTDRLPNIILLDVEMPVKDGIQTMREIRESSRFGHVPVIMVTSRTGIKHRTLAEEAGCNGYMGKPFNFRMLVSQISELTGQHLEIDG
ncbi:hybrid sensor histidine kinase/response regulator [Halioglobus maricola]|uniref:Hybrid sensor histidine kinase/response regulator n=1 Tax=Halioglobus maricola TaxID=2601894 RepID=A0A5P9NIK4_9GAMM|nr:response regulator [Halioglobus maricola]QFU75034.1 hybrid sensor histidine kinase/response regulator [Halioglobus maricola]